MIACFPKVRPRRPTAIYC